LPWADRTRLENRQEQTGHTGHRHPARFALNVCAGRKAATLARTLYAGITRNLRALKTATGGHLPKETTMVPYVSLILVILSLVLSAVSILDKQRPVLFLQLAVILLALALIVR